MPEDPTDPETLETDDDEEVELDEETPEADAVEQHTEVRPRGDEPLTRIDPGKASEGDAVEQARAVDPDEDDEDYR
ncbi:hypothetical protein [Streptomyces sp. AK02-01A]|uniref:hypothetical protein n=1 Tax=Streptomyces sp. AK02-01A TaxID=3028648 RepID=UPI0029A4CEAA|nr:hypothetical protein [Streptomyces sp. AK02-01A]MDX3852514.1 hypothetical protein [Streptomyces sp. AK02-01A]